MLIEKNEHINQTLAPIFNSHPCFKPAPSCLPQYPYWPLVNLKLQFCLHSYPNLKGRCP